MRAESPSFVHPGRITMILSVMLLAVGCSTPPPPYRLYEGAVRDPKEIAIIQGQVPVIISRVDGKRGPRNFDGYDAFIYHGRNIPGLFTLELEPGCHTLAMNYDLIAIPFYRGKGWHSLKATWCRMNLEAGKVYEVKATITPDSSGNKIIDAVASPNSATISFSFTDKSTGAALKVDYINPNK